MAERRYPRRQILTGGLAGAAVVLTRSGLAAASVPVGGRLSGFNRRTLQIVAHPDDDLLFLSPDELVDIAAGRAVRTVFLTSGDLGIGSSYWQGREAGVLAAFAEMANTANTWTSGTLGVNGRQLALRSLSGKPQISVVFMRLPDGQVDGSGFAANNNESLQKLWTDAIAQVHSVDGTASYAKQDLVSSLASMMIGYVPDLIRTQDYVGTYGADHSDHYTTAYFTQTANGFYGGARHELLAYLGYNSTSNPPNVSDDLVARRYNAFLAYAPYDPNVPQTTSQIQQSPMGGWLARQYSLGAAFSGVTVSNVRPHVGSRAGGTRVSIRGEGFEPGAVVQFGTLLAQAVNYLSSTRLVAVAPRTTNKGPVAVTVTIPGGTSLPTRATTFTYR